MSQIGLIFNSFKIAAKSFISKWYQNNTAMSIYSSS